MRPGAMVLAVRATAATALLRAAAMLDPERDAAEQAVARTARSFFVHDFGRAVCPGVWWPTLDRLRRAVERRDHVTPPFDRERVGASPLTEADRPPSAG